MTEEVLRMTLVVFDLHSQKQQVAVLDTDTGKVLEQELLHEGDAVERFYRALPRPVTVGIEATGYALWFHALMQKLGDRMFLFTFWCRTIMRMSIAGLFLKPGQIGRASGRAV